VFMVSKYLHTSTLNEHGHDDAYPSLGVGCVQKTKLLSTSLRRADVLEDMVDFSILENYNRQISKDLVTFM
jgi:hypothetical protein